MKNLWVAAMGLVMALTVGVSCSNKPSCRLLYERQKKCAEAAKKGPLDRDVFLAYCKKARKRPAFQKRIACSAHSDCAKFLSCVNEVERKQERERMTARWRELQKELAQGRFVGAEAFCRIWDKDLVGEMKSACAGLPARAYEVLYDEFTKKRDAGDVGYKSVVCYRLTSYAKKAGGDRVKKAETLCAEIRAVRVLQRVEKDVERRMRRLSSAYLPSGCAPRRIRKIQTISTPFAKKLAGKLVHLCYEKLAVALLKKYVPGQRYCKVGLLYQSVQEVGARSPELDRLMQEAGKECKKKK